MFAKKILLSLLIVLTIIVGVACRPQTNIVYNDIVLLNEGTPPYIEGSYTETMNASSFQELTGINIEEYISENENNYMITSCFDKDNNILNLSARIKGKDSEGATTIYVYSKEQWSELSYSPVEYSYGDGNSVDATVSVIDDVEVRFYRYDDSKSEYEIGYDVLYADLNLNGLSFFVESTIMSKSEFEEFITSIIKSTGSN